MGRKKRFGEFGFGKEEEVKTKYVVMEINGVYAANYLSTRRGWRLSRFRDFSRCFASRGEAKRAMAKVAPRAKGKLMIGSVNWG
jgi:hypothetical protein